MFLQPRLVEESLRGLGVAGRGGEEGDPEVGGLIVCLGIRGMSDVWKMNGCGRLISSGGGKVYL